MGIFHACDIRGVAGQDLSDYMVRRIALAVGTQLTGQTVVVGGDIRRSTPRLMYIVLEALAESGCKVIDIGTVATPVFYYAMKKSAAQSGIMITASHNPARYNGLKLVLGPKPVSAEDIQKIAGLAERNARVTGQGSIEQRPIVQQYIADTAQKAAKGALKVVVDAGNGATAKIAPEVFRKAGYEVVELFCEPDGTFPNRPPNPALAENLKALGRKVVECGAALGVGFDGDGDRAGFVDETGKPVDNDAILVLLARHYLAGQQGTVIYDAKCSMVVPEQIAQSGGKPIMARAGHTFSKAAFLSENALFAGEISGHFFFQELGYDDGIFAGLKVCEIVSRKGALSRQVAALPSYMLTPDIRVPYYGDKDQLMQEVAASLAEYRPNLIDGVRVEFNDGWGMLRGSVTEPLITLRFEAKTLKRLAEIKNIILNALPEDVKTAVIAKMPPE